MSNENEGQESNASTFQNFLIEAQKVIGDASALEVLTFTGKLENVIHPPDDQENPNKFKWADLFTQVSQPKGTISLVAATQQQLDGDMTFFVAENISQSLLQSHIEATAAAQKYREGLILGLTQALGLK